MRERRLLPGLTGVRSRAALLAVLAAAGLVACGAEPAAVAPAQPAAQPSDGGGGELADVPVPVLRWEPCPRTPDGPDPGTPGLRCAAMDVPADYTRPRGPTVRVEVSRLSTGPGRPALVSNPGGPGAPGLFNTFGVDALTGSALRGRFDLVGMDPRGVGHSSPVDCGLDPETAAAGPGDAPPRDPVTDEAAARRIAVACGSREGDRLPTITTRNTARDLDMLRRALDVDTLSIVGTSYGTELAIAYGAMFPRTTGRVLLDGVTDTTVPPARARAEAAPAADARFTRIAERIAGQDARFHLGSTPEAVRATYLRTLRQLQAAPRTVGGMRVDPPTLQSAQLAPALDDDASVDSFATVLAFLSGAPGAPTEQELVAGLGSGTAGTSARSGLPNGQTTSQAVSAYWAVRCDDAVWDRDAASYRDAQRREAERYPVTRGAYSGVTPCAFWPSEPRERPGAMSGAGWTADPDMLILQNTGDLRAPPSGVDAVRAALGGRAVSVVAGGDEHGLLGTNDCATSAAVRWLVDGRMPGPGERRC